MGAGETRPEGQREPRDRRSRDRYGRDRRERGPREAEEAAQAAALPTQEEPPRRSYFATPPAPAAQPAAAPVTAAGPAAPVAAAAAPEAAAPQRQLPKVQSFELPLAELVQVAERSGLQWINSDAAKIAAVQAAIAAEPKPIHVPRERPPAIVLDEGPLILVETKRDLREMKLPFEQGAAQPQ